MSLGVKLSAFTAALVLAGSAFAMDTTCPNLSDLQAEGISMSEPLGNNYYVGYSLAHFNSSSNWGFAIGPVQAESDEDAIDVSNQILNNMTAPAFPLELDNDVLVCLYDTGNPYIYSIAVRDYAISPMKLKQYLQKIRK
ncbi:DUF4949 domain-containing protein [Fluoribacter dumoffii]|uniref:Hemin binding protein Hbp n=1 Tax=Fluoribacter dumoffii TaxID=463 RepID=A0A377G7M5_9GAMM|nr:DUF4949 domain-containing protein [Fluoribacter dumoffii]KTC89710.1 hypothetical protein Ldum_0778 [Fluoribacter dumoffii NY 23]MCW8384904.1 DUF4949 domain-containing protein [Fluoribacter dumoffii]MCW8417966.1 DUF4949 domain-containing protein [Fluoribacter dumoffii]MCW8454192.1 DUF4949 domain-containing protein [Fluoribacter dumoffii]MCW8461734.1 DUF4949 domain-containing protein [Fluoribacter dumoffii]